MIETDGRVKTSLASTEDAYKHHLNPSLSRLLKFSGYYAEECHAEGVYVYDEKGNRYIDCAGGYGVFVLGHRHPAVVKAVKAQLDQMPLSTKVFFNRQLGECARRLASLCGGGLQYCFFCNSGAEAIEGAIKLARISKGKHRIISTINSFHGKTLGALSVSGRDIYKKGCGPLIEDVVQIPFGDAEALRSAINDNTAAFIVEPVQGEGGIIVSPDGYLQEVRKICTERGVLFIADEVQTGMGRTGTFFAVEQWNVWPDMLTLAKGLGGGVMPVGAIIGTAEAWKPFQENPLIHTSTFGGNQLACAAALATIEVITGENLPGRAEEHGKYFMAKLREVQERYPDIIAEVRGRGLMIGVEMIRESYGGSIIFEMSRGRVTGVYTLNNQKVIRFEPPLIIEKNEIDQAVAVFEKAVEKTKKTFVK
ncbi:MAG: aspartate aminotransferase family protein [Candidatus Eremiobacteraeota bacterium]|nr:aspartate aminotransferase family protein [Candidatus Eremiobacteraeota bacterium]